MLENNIRIAAFLSQYISYEDDPVLPPEPEVLKGCLGILTEERGFTQTEIRRICAKQYRAIIPESWFSQE